MVEVQASRVVFAATLALKSFLVVREPGPKFCVSLHDVGVDLGFVSLPPFALGSLNLLRVLGFPRFQLLGLVHCISVSVVALAPLIAKATPDVWLGVIRCFLELAGHRVHFAGLQLQEVVIVNLLQYPVVGDAA